MSILTFAARYPGPTLRALELLQEERFRKDILIPEVVNRMVQEGFEASISGS
jgi:mediator of RNA polymerase II transcription subunit 31